MKVYLELFFARLIEKDIVYYKEVIDITDSKQNPDTIVNDFILKTIKIINNKFIIHSTSWRYEQDGKVILTYLIYSDYLEFENKETCFLPINKLEIAIGSDLKHPRPSVINEKNIISHAIRHLDFLVNGRDDDKYSKTLNPNTISRLQEVSKTISGEL